MEIVGHGTRAGSGEWSQDARKTGSLPFRWRKFALSVGTPRILHRFGWPARDRLSQCRTHCMTAEPFAGPGRRVSVGILGTEAPRVALAAVPVSCQPFRT